jgi:hypothetical protein
MKSFLRPFAVATCSGAVIALTLSGAARAIIDAVFKYSSPQTGWLMINSAAFVLIKTTDYTISISSPAT